MIDQILNFADYLKDKNLFPFLRQLLNLLLTISISSFIFEKFYFEYIWINPDDYKSILNFLLKGYFFIPFSIFFIVWTSTYLFSYLSFSLFNFYIAEKYKEKIIRFSFEKNEAKQRMEKLTQGLKVESVEKVDSRWFIQYFKVLKKEIKPEMYQKMHHTLHTLQDNMIKNFTLFFRGFIASTIYLFIIPHFGWLLYLLLLIIMIVSSFLFSLGYQLAELVPTLAIKAAYEMNNFIKKNEVKEIR